MRRFTTFFDGFRSFENVYRALNPRFDRLRELRFRPTARNRTCLLSGRSVRPPGFSTATCRFVGSHGRHGGPSPPDRLPVRHRVGRSDGAVGDAVTVLPTVVGVAALTDLSLARPPSDSPSSKSSGDSTAATRVGRAGEGARGAGHRRRFRNRRVRRRRPPRRRRRLPSPLTDPSAPERLEAGCGAILPGFAPTGEDVARSPGDLAAAERAVGTDLHVVSPAH